MKKKKENKKNEKKKMKKEKKEELKSQEELDKEIWDSFITYKKGEKIDNYLNEKREKARKKYKESFHNDITDSFNNLGNFTTSKASRFKNPYKISNYREIRNIINFITDSEMRSIDEFDIIDDYMLIENYDNTNKSVNLKVYLKQMLELKNQY